MHSPIFKSRRKLAGCYVNSWLQVIAIRRDQGMEFRMSHCSGQLPFEPKNPGETGPIPNWTDLFWLKISCPELNWDKPRL